MTTDGGKTWIQQLLRDRPFPLQLVDNKYIMTIGDDALWRAEYRSFCDSTTSGVSLAENSRPNRFCTTNETSIEIDLRPFRFSGSIDLVICDMIGRTLVHRCITGDEKETPLHVDLSSHGSGLYIVAIIDRVSSTSETVLLCD
jgi:hypothetical protein